MHVNVLEFLLDEFVKWKVEVFLLRIRSLVKF